MLAYTYKKHEKFELTDKPKPEIIDSRDAAATAMKSSRSSNKAKLTQLRLSPTALTSKTSKKHTKSLRISLME